jgi:hypothetical protein
MVLDLAKLLDAKAQLVAQSAKEELVKKQQQLKEVQKAQSEEPLQELEERRFESEKKQPAQTQSLDDLIGGSQPQKSQQEIRSFVAYESNNPAYTANPVYSSGMQQNPSQTNPSRTNPDQTYSASPTDVIRDVKHLNTSKASRQIYKS